jgi:stage II sporulation protein D
MRLRSRVGWAFLVTGVVTFLAVMTSTAARAQTVRVLIVEGKPAVRVASAGGVTLADSSGRFVLARTERGEAYRLVPFRQAVQVRETGASAAPVVVWPGRGAQVTVDGQAYRGRLEVHRVGPGLTVVNVVQLEDYLQGVLKDEIPTGWPLEAAKAVAVAARTYAVYQMDQNAGTLFDLRATTASQVYGGAVGEDPRTTAAVEATRGQILTFAGQPFPAFYHACSGGNTEDAVDVFGVNFDMVVGVKDDFSLGCPYGLWVERLTPSQVERALARAGYSLGRVLGIQDLLRSRTGRILQIAVQHSGGTLVLEGRRFREALGTEAIRSTDFQVRADAGGFTFVGRGWGHGAGLSQWGAKEMADMAYHYREILRFYYPLAEVASLDGSRPGQWLPTRSATR